MVISSVHGEGENRKFEHMLVAPRVNETHTRLLDVLKKGKVHFIFILFYFAYFFILCLFLCIFYFHFYFCFISSFKS